MEITHVKETEAGGLRLRATVRRDYACQGDWAWRLCHSGRLCVEIEPDVTGPPGMNQLEVQAVEYHQRRGVTVFDDPHARDVSQPLAYHGIGQERADERGGPDRRPGQGDGSELADAVWVGLREVLRLEFQDRVFRPHVLGHDPVGLPDVVPVAVRAAHLPLLRQPEQRDHHERRGPGYPAERGQPS